MKLNLPEPEIIGAPECPIMYRWTLWPRVRSHPRGTDGMHVFQPAKKDVRCKLLLHRFLPNADDRDVHDHPRPFWTLVLFGAYDDMAPCDWCGGSGNTCRRCSSTGVVLRERMRPGMLRYRRAKHLHRTRTSPRGCWTLVLMGPVRRRWGFLRFGRWWFWKDYEDEFGYGMRCD